jgi:hypothetical protein
MIARTVVWLRTDSIINRMALYTISTGLVTSILSCIVLVMVRSCSFISCLSMINLVLNYFMGAVC